MAKQIHKATTKEHVHALSDDWNDDTAFCLSLARVFPSMRTKPTPFSHTNSWIIHIKIVIAKLTWIKTKYQQSMVATLRWTKHSKSAEESKLIPYHKHSEIMIIEQSVIDQNLISIQ